MSRTFVLALASVVVVFGALVIFVRDVRIGRKQGGAEGWSAGGSGTSRSPRFARVVAEAAIPLAGVAALVWWAWAVL